MPDSFAPFFTFGTKTRFRCIRDVAVVMERKPIIEAKGLSYAYSGADGSRMQVLNQLDLQIEAGSFVSIIGPNGSGKSTLAKLFNALFIPNEGTLLVGGLDTRDTASIWEIRRNVGMIFQNPDNQIIGTTVEDDVAFGLENAGVPPNEMRKRVDEALQAVQMESYALSQPHKLSGGQKQRVAIAGAIALRPRILIMDEATAMLDPAGRKEVMALVHRLHRDEGITIVNITHFPEETLDSDRIIVLRDGRIFRDGTPEQVYREPETLQAIGLEVPLAVRLSHRLVQQGIPLTPQLRQEGLVEEICKLLSRT